MSNNLSAVRPATIIEPTRTTAVIPPFSFAQAWNGASQLLAQFPVGNTDRLFALKRPLPTSEDYVFAIRWVDGSDLFRYKFAAQGELFWPVYTGEDIGLNAVLELWNVEESAAQISTANINLYLSWLSESNNFSCPSCCAVPVAQTISLIDVGFTELEPDSPENPFDVGVTY